MHDIQALNDQMMTAFHSAFPGDDRRLVFGEGPVESPRLMLIGEAPGAQEAEQGRPFVGKAGQNLNEFLQAIGLNRPEIRISNVVKVRPSKVSPKGTVSNRPPNRAELSFFTPWLHREILLTQPALIVTLGNTPLQALIPGVVIGDCHGEVREAWIEGIQNPVFPLYHPAAIIYNRSLKETYQEDLLKLKAFLEGVQV